MRQVRALVSNEGRERIEETIGGVDVVRLPRQVTLSSAPVAFGMPGALRDELRRQGPGGPEAPDIINLHSPYPWGELSFLWAPSARAQRRALPQRHRAPEAPARCIPAFSGAVS